MLKLASLLYFVLGVFVLFHVLTFKEKKKGDFTGYLLLLLLFTVGTLFLAMPSSYNYLVVIPLLFFFPIVVALSLAIKEGLPLFASIFATVSISLGLAFLHTSDPIMSFGLALLSIPVAAMAYFVLTRYIQEDLTRVLYSLSAVLIVAIFILTNRYLEFVLFNFVMTLPFIGFLNSCDRVKKSFEEYVRAILSLPSGLSSEIRRKLMHSFVFFVFLPLPLLYELFDYGVNAINDIMQLFAKQHVTLTLGASPILVGAMILTGSLIPIFIVMDILRLDFGISIVPEKLLRKHEVNTFGGHVYITLALLVVAMLFTERIFLTSAAVAFISDSASAIVGRAFGKHKIVEGRSLEGTLAGILAATLSAMPFVPLLPAIVVGIVIGITDILIANKINDNLVFPLVTALTLLLIL